MNIDWFSIDWMWFLLGIAFFLFEFILPSFALVFFGAGAWLVALLCWIQVLDNVIGQLAVFLGFSVLSLVVFRKVLVNQFKINTTL